MKQMITITMGLAAAALAAQQAFAQGNNNCAPRPVVLEQLTVKHGETRQSIGVAANNSVVEVFTSEDTGSWTITVTLPSGITCIVASGQSFETLAEALPPREEQA
ncbi:MAG: hypothetical protein JJ897_16880 [Marinibacterium sp.]|nr:hypothetical protein [Marinibacterium sp.]